MISKFRYSHIAWLIVLGMALLFLDFISKAYIYHLFPGNLSGSLTFHLFGIKFSIFLATNRGAAWGILADFQLLLIIVRSAVILGLFFYLFFINRTTRLILPLVVVIAGALGNMVDYFLYGFVIDFLSVNLWGYQFPIFNFADSCITIGVVWLFLASYRSKKNHAAC